GSVWCWGQSETGRAGHDPSQDLGCTSDIDGGPYACNPTPTRVPLPSSEIVVDVAAADSLACARTGAGAVWCWGDNKYGALARPPSIPPTFVPATRPVPPDDAVAISLGLRSWHVCVVRAGGSVWCWGQNGRGEIGHTPGDAGDALGTDGTPYNATPLEVKS